MYVSVLFVRGLLGEVQQRGISLDELVRDTGLTPAELSDIQFRAPIEALEKLAQNAVALTGDPALGLSIGVNAPRNALQVLGHLVLACRTPRHAFDAYLRHAPHVAQGAQWELCEDDARATIYYLRPGLTGDIARLAADGVIATLVTFGRVFAPGYTPLEVHFRHAEPTYAERYQQLFGCPVYFERERNALVFPRALCDREQFHADDAMVEELHETASRLLHEARGGTTAERVRVVLRGRDDLSTLGLPEVARRFAISERTLRTRLTEEGHAFSQLVDDERCRRAQRELRKSDASIKSAAERAGFSDRSAFHRAFKRWTGQTPAQYLQELSSTRS